MTEHPIDDSTAPAGEKLEDPLARERLDKDAREEPNAPNREPTSEPVRHDQKPDVDLQKPSTDDVLDRPDNPAHP